MNKNSNTYIILYASIMVIVVAAALTFIALSLSDRQAENVRIEKMGDILRSIGQAADMDKVSDKTQYITEEYEKYITDSYAVNVAGDRIDDVDAFTLLVNLKAEYDKAPEERRLPLFVSRDDQGKVTYVIPLWGSGLWGAVWGYVALADDWDTITGAVFDHAGETPGLGAEIAGIPFQAQFRGKQIIKNGEVVGISLVKGTAGSDPYAVDALSGGTLTSHGVQNMIKDNLADYSVYIKKQRAGGSSAPVAAALPESTEAVQPADSLTNNQ